MLTACSTLPLLLASNKPNRWSDKGPRNASRSARKDDACGVARPSELELGLGDFEDPWDPLPISDFVSGPKSSSESKNRAFFGLGSMVEKWRCKTRETCFNFGGVHGGGEKGKRCRMERSGTNETGISVLAFSDCKEENGICLEDFEPLPEI